MNKYFVFGDIHGEYHALGLELEKAGYDAGNPKHILVSLGDNFDRGNQSHYVYELLHRNTRNICIKGNHELFLEEALEKGIDGEFVYFNILHNGLYNTICAFAGIPEKDVVSSAQLQAYINRAKERYPQLLQWIKGMPLYFETKHYFFCHAGVDPNIYPKLPDEHFMLWDIEYSHVPIRVANKTFVIGHHHAFRVKENAERAGYKTTTPKVPWYGCTDENAPVVIGNKIAIDACSNLTHKVNVLVIEDEPLVNDEPEEPTITINRDNDVRITSTDGPTYTIHYGDGNFTWDPRVTYATYRQNQF